MFVPLHVKSDYSLGYGTAGVEELVALAATLGYQTLALTDLENLCAQIRFHHECRRHGLRPLSGIELRPGFDGRRHVGSRAGRVVLLAADLTGYSSLCRLVSRRRGAIGPRAKGPCGLAPLPLVASHTEGLFALSDDPLVIEQLLESFPRRRLGLLLVRPEDRAADLKRQEAAARLGISLVADLDPVFLRPADRSLHALQLAIRTGQQLGAIMAGNEIESAERWLRGPAEAAALFADRPEVVAAAAELAAACHLELGGKEIIPAAFADEKESSERLHVLCAEVVNDHQPEAVWTEAHRKRLATELAVFDQLGFSGFILVVAEILSHCRREGIPVAVRGSAVSSLALHLLGGSPVDPLAHGLLFERFLHAGKSAWPDVDLDLPWHRRDEVIAWVFRYFGRERVAMVAAHHTFRQRAALREGLKAWGARPALIETLGRALPPEDLAVEEIDFLGLAEALPEPEPASLTTLAAPGLSEILPLIQRLVGRPRHLAAHPGGIVVGRGPLADLLPLERAPKGVVITQYDLVAVARLGLVKFDLLGNRCLSELEEAFALAGRPGPLRLENLPREDPETLALIDRAKTLGCFQLESPAMRGLLARIPIRSEKDLIAALALIRPGAAAGEAKAAFIRRARGEEPDELPLPLLADRLAETHGLLLYEEDLMVLLSRAGGLGLGEADELRAAIVDSGGDPAALARLEAGFLEKAEAAGGEAVRPRANQAWAAAARFAAYSFNKAHAASYARLAYLSAYTKAHHLLPFGCALLNHHQGLYPLRTLAAELVRLGVVLRRPHVNRSAYHSLLEDQMVRVGLDKVKGLSSRAAGEILEERAARGPFASVRELLDRVRLSRQEISNLVLAGAADDLPPLAAADYPFAHEATLNFLREGGDPAALDRLAIRPISNRGRMQLYRSLVRVRNELRILKMHLHAHPLALLREEAVRHRCLPLAEAAARPAGARVRLAALIAAMRRVPTRRGPMQFLTVEDETGLLEAAVPPAAYRRLDERVTTPGPFLVEGTVVRQQEAVHLEVVRLSPFYQRERPFGE